MLYGYIFEWDGFVLDSNISNREVFTSRIANVPNLSFWYNLKKNSSNRWIVLEFKSNRPLLGEHEDQSQQTIVGTQLRSYPVYVRINEQTKTIIYASQRYTVTDASILAFNSFVTPNFRRRVIDIDRLSRRLLEVGQGNKRFCVTYYMADVPGYGAALNTVSLYGEDIGAADFLSEERANFTARHIGVRTTNSRIEAGRFTNAGAIQFRLEGIADLEKFLSFTYEEKLYVD
jgi:hypothetical protein